MLRNRVRSMAETLARRGPDDADEWVDAASGVGLGFRRLAIIDLSPAGRQPMTSESGRFVIVFNGEVYNYVEIRKELERDGFTPKYRGESDTEVILAAIEAYGIERAVSKFIGMFAIALWDNKTRSLSLIRDRLGVKPLYYGWVEGAFVFGSEIKALKAHPGFSAEIDRHALALMFRYAYVPAPYSIYKGINKLPAGTILKIQTGQELTTPTPEQYWSASSAVEQALRNPFGGTDLEAIDNLDALLRNATALRMIADVPLGVFLSGGIDSSLVTALMQVQSSSPVKTFTIGFEDDTYDEADYARAVAKHLGTNHTELTLSASVALAAIPEMPAIFDEPFADASQIPTYLVSKLAREHVTVSLSGDGGDEMFGGYVRHFGSRKLWDGMRNIPRWMRSAAAHSVESVNPGTWDSIIRNTSGLLPQRLRQRNPVEKLSKMAGTLSASSPDEMYTLLVSHWKWPENAVIGSGTDSVVSLHAPACLEDVGLRMMFLDTVCYLPDDILVKVDRASMGVSLEARSPFLDHRVLDFAWSLPISMKLRNDEGKWLVKQLLYRYLPEQLFIRPKAGFSVPVDEWLRGPLREWGETLLDEARLTREGYLNPEPIRKVWREHQDRHRNNHAMLWNVLMFQAWLEIQ